MIKYFQNGALQAKEMAELYSHSGVESPITDLSLIQKMLDHSNLIISAREGGKLVGVARAVTDFGYACYLCDISVDQKKQRLGIGRALITLMRKAIGLDVSLILMSDSKSTGFYEALGFKSIANGYIAEGMS